MRVVVVGLGVQGKKRLSVAGDDAVATVDPVSPDARYEKIEEVDLGAFDAAMVCTPDQAKPSILKYLLSHGKHVLVEKPLLSSSPGELDRLGALARSTGAACYTAYNHRFEPHVARLKEVLDAGALGRLYFAKFFYGNGTALDVKRSEWRDRGLGVLPDLGSHMLDMALFLFGHLDASFRFWSFDRFENRACDHVVLGSRGHPVLEMEATLLSWRNTFRLDVFAEKGSAHIDCLCKWGPSTLTVRRRVLPSGRPSEDAQTIVSADPTWALEYEHFKRLCRTGGSNIENDLWIDDVLNGLARDLGRGVEG
jgi:predicted dehydrogenase